MIKQPDPEVFTLDLIGGNGTPFRFMFWPKEHQATEEGTIRYYDRRYILTEGEPGYGINHTNENGQSCGGPLLVSSFTNAYNYGFGSGIRGWNEVDAWDIDRHTVALVGNWIASILEARSWD